MDERAAGMGTNPVMLESIGALAAGVAHEITTPVQFVGDNLAFIARSLESMAGLVAAWETARGAMRSDPALTHVVAALEQVANDIDLDYLMRELPAAVEQSRDGINRVGQIARALKGFSHPSDAVAPHDLNRLVSDTVHVAKSEWTHVAELVLDLDPTLPPVPVAPGSLGQALLNLLVNAAHAIQDRRVDGDPAGTITVTTSHTGGQAVLEISDNGCGIPDHVAQRMFDQFFTTKALGRGTGQGLAQVHAAIGALGGSIDFRSAVGRGTTFAISLPLGPLEPTEDPGAARLIGV